MTQGNLPGLRQFVGRYSRLLDFIEDFQNEFFRGVAFCRLNCCIDSEQSRITRSVGKRRDTKSESGLFAHPPVKARAAALTQNGREEIERRNVGMRDLRNVPRERESGQLGLEFLVNDAQTELRRLARDIDRLERFRRALIEESTESVIDRFS